MKGIKLKVLWVFFLGCSAIGQNLQSKGIIVDKNTKLPLENVVVYNEKDNSITNSEGAFVFVSSINQINFNLLGYNEIATTFEALAKKDTIFMEPKAFELKEVVVSNAEPFMKKVFDKMKDNVISNYTTDFFLRNVLKKDTTIVKLQDIYGKRNRDKALKNVNSIEVQNMRKTSLLERKMPDLKFPDFNEFFSPPFPILDKCFFRDENFKDADYKKIAFETKDKTPWGQTLKGYFIINEKDYGIVEYFITMMDVIETIPYKKIFLTGTQYRTIKYERILRYSQDKISNKYYISSSKLNADVEVLADKKEKGFIYSLKMDYFTTNSASTEKVDSNFSIDTDIFKAKFPYSTEFWDNQNQLPLTTDLKNFLKRVAENKDKKKEFEFIGNF